MCIITGISYFYKLEVTLGISWEERPYKLHHLPSSLKPRDSWRQKAFNQKLDQHWTSSVPSERGIVTITFSWSATPNAALDSQITETHVCYLLLCSFRKVIVDSCIVQNGVSAAAWGVGKFWKFHRGGGLTLGVDFTKSSREGGHTTKPFLWGWYGYFLQPHIMVPRIFSK